ncbi:MAG: HAD family hydrolase [bacterium]
MGQQKRALFFDFGGTLMDYESDRRAHAEMMEGLRARYGVAESVEELTAKYNRSIGSLLQDPLGSQMILGREIVRRSFHFLMASLGLTPERKDLHWFRHLYVSKHREHLRLYPEAQGVLRTLRGSRLHIGLISDIDHDFMIDQLTRLSIIDLFDSLTCSEEAGVWKPDPRIFELALSKAGCTGPEAIHIGDNLERDIKGAKHMGMTTVWFPNTSEAISDEPDYCIDSLKEVLDVVRSECAGLENDLLEARRKELYGK